MCTLQLSISIRYFLCGIDPKLKSIMKHPTHKLRFGDLHCLPHPQTKKVARMLPEKNFTNPCSQLPISLYTARRSLGQGKEKKKQTNKQTNKQLRLAVSQTRRIWVTFVPLGHFFSCIINNKGNQK